MTTLIKLGGSLLNLTDLRDRVCQLIATLDDGPPLLLAGGGPCADVVRDWDRIHSLSVEQSHWLAIDSMSLTARLLATLFPDADVAMDRRTAQRSLSRGRIAIIEASGCLADLQAEATSDLPIGWHVTSDSIAAWLAIHWPVERLVLAKSVGPPAIRTAESAACDGAVDACFETFRDALPVVSWVNLRESPGDVVQWQV